MPEAQGKLCKDISRNWQEDGGFEDFLRVKINGYNTVDGMMKHLFEKETPFMKDMRETWETMDVRGFPLTDCNVPLEPFNLLQYAHMLNGSVPAVVQADPAVAQAGQAVAQAGQAVAQAGQAVVQADPAVAQAGQAVVQAGSVVVQSDPAVAQGNQAVAQAGQAVVQADPAVPQADPAVAQTDPAVAQGGQAVAQAGQAVVQADPAVAQADPAVAQIAQGVANLNFIQRVHPMFGDLQTEQEKYERVKFILTTVSQPFQYVNRIVTRYPSLQSSTWRVITRNSRIPQQTGCIKWTYTIPLREHQPANFRTYLRNTFINDIRLQDILSVALENETEAERSMRRHHESTIYQSENVSIDTNCSDPVRDGIVHQDFNNFVRTFIRDAHHANRNILREISIAIQKTYMNIAERFTEARRLQLNEIEYRREMSNILRNDIGFSKTVAEEHFYEIRSSSSNTVRKFADIRMEIEEIRHVWIFELKRHRGRCHDVTPRFKHKEQLYMYCMMERMIQQEESNGMRVHGVLVYFCNNGISYWYMEDHRYRMRNIQSIDSIDFYTVKTLIKISLDIA